VDGRNTLGRAHSQSWEKTSGLLRIRQSRIGFSEVLSCLIVKQLDKPLYFATLESQDIGSVIKVIGDIINNLAPFEVSKEPTCA